MKRGVVVSDTQCGSIYGMLPPFLETSENIVKPQNAAQVYLWDCWEHFSIRSGEFDPDFIVFNGDGIDGGQEAQKGTELSLPMKFDQKRAFVATMQFLMKSCPNAKLYAVQGTEYHEMKGAEALEDAMQVLGAQQYRGAGTGIFCKEVLDLDVEGTLFNFAHHISVNSGFYRATAADREGQWSAMTAKDASKGIPKADIVIRSHVHNFIHVEHASKHIIQTPAWQLQTRFMRKHSVYRMLPDIGGIHVSVDPTARERGEDPFKLIKHLYPLPPAPVTAL
jgi:hypothetical protein